MMEETYPSATSGKEGTLVGGQLGWHSRQRIFTLSPGASQYRRHMRYFKGLTETVSGGPLCKYVYYYLRCSSHTKLMSGISRNCY